MRCAVLLLASVPLLGQPGPQLERTAARLSYFCAQNFFYDLPGCFGQREEDYLKSVAEISAVKAQTSELVSLLDHDDPKVRTLTIALLFTSGDPKVLPWIAAKAADTSPTFLDVLPDARPLLADLRRQPLLQPRTVGQIAQAAVRPYLESAGIYGGVGGAAGYPGFESYWMARKDRSYCAGWFRVELDRASGRTSPTQPERVSKIKAVRGRIDRLPEPDRTWTLLWLNGELGSDALVSEQELLEATKRLGAGRLMGMLQRRIGTSDPDLQPRENNNYSYARMTRWVLERAGSLLRVRDAEALMECEKRERESGFADPNVTAWWVIGASELRPALATAVLPEALKRFQAEWHGDDRAQLAAAIWRSPVPEKTGFLREWFYRESPQRGRFPHSRALFLRLLGSGPTTELRRLIAAILGDERLESLDWQTLEALARTVNAVAGKPVVPQSELGRASHPLGQAHFYWESETAAKQYPKETAELLRILEDWRSRMRASAAGW